MSLTDSDGHFMYLSYEHKNFMRKLVEHSEHTRNLKSRREKLIYLAAIIDGEGSIGIEHLSPCKVTRKGKESWQRKKSYYTCRLCVINTFEPLISWIEREFGGSINMKKKNLRSKPCFRWHIFGSSLESLLKELSPFLLVKAEQAKVLLDYRKTVCRTRWKLTDEILEERKKLWLKCKHLNKTGDL